MKAETREVRSHPTVKPEPSRKAKAKRKVPQRPIVNNLSDQDFQYLLEGLNRLWVRRGRSLDAEDFAQMGAIRAWLKQGNHTGKDGATLRTYSYTVGLSEGRSAVRHLVRQEGSFEKNKRSIAENFGEGPDPSMDSGCYRIIEGNRVPIFREPSSDSED